MDSNAMLPGSYNQIGTACSSGCLRTTCSAAAWIYYNCAVGTQVVIANDSQYSSGRPASVPNTQTWDPTDPGAKPEIPVTSFSVSITPGSLLSGESAQVNVTAILPSNTNTASFAYVSLHPSIASVDGSGRVTAIAPGVATIRVTANDVGAYSKTLTVTVTAPAPTPTTTPVPTETPTPSGAPTPGDTPTPSITPTPGL